MKFPLCDVRHILYEVNRIFKPVGNGWQQDAISSIKSAIAGMKVGAALEDASKVCEIIKGRVPYPCEGAAIRAIEIEGRRIPLRVGVPTGYGERDCLWGSYYITAGHIECPVKIGKVTIHYRRYPTDKKGFPLVIDEYNYKKAIEWHIMKDMMAAGFKHHTFDYRYCDNEWEKFSSQAVNIIKMPNREEMEVLGRMWTTLINTHDYYDNFGDGAEQRESYDLDLDLPTWVDRNRLNTEH